MKNGKVASLMISAGVTLISVGVLNILAELSEKVKNFLILYNPVGPYSGKILFGVLIGFIVWLLIYGSLKEKEVNLRKVFLFLVLALLLATLFVFTPFISLLV